MICVYERCSCVRGLIKHICYYEMVERYSFHFGETQNVLDINWRNIVSKVNAHGVTVRTVSEVKDKWRAMVMGAKKDFSREKRERRKTGGGKEPAAATQRSEKIIQMFGDEPSFSGIPGGIESGTPYGNFCSLSSFLSA